MINARHPDRNAFERFSRGVSSAVEERWIEDHLRAGCVLCQREVDELLLRAFALPSAESVDQDAAWDRIFASLGARLSRAAAERKEAPALLDELLGRPWEEWPVLFRLDRRLQTIAVCELLIEKSFEEGFRDAHRAIALADRGLLLAGLLEGDRYGRAVVQDLQARAWAYLGNARRIAYDLAGALRATRREVVCFCSANDQVILNWGTWLFGTVDRVYGPSAGLRGFADGAQVAHLSPDHDAAARVYGRLGFTEAPGFDVYVDL